MCVRETHVVIVILIFIKICNSYINIYKETVNIVNTAVALSWWRWWMIYLLSAGGPRVFLCYNPVGVESLLDCNVGELGKTLIFLFPSV